MLFFVNFSGKKRTKMRKHLVWEWERSITTHGNSKNCWKRYNIWNEVHCKDVTDEPLRKKDVGNNKHKFELKSLKGILKVLYTEQESISVGCQPPA